MKKSVKIVLIITLIIVCALLFIIPFSVRAEKQIMKLPDTSQASIEQENQKERERALREKAKFEEEHKNDTTQQIQQYSTEERDESIDKALEEVEEKSNKFDNIMNKYVPNEYKTIIEKLNNENNEKLVDVQEQNLSDNDIEYYNLIFKVIEKNNLTDEEKNIIKDKISNLMYEIEKDDDLLIRAKAILQ